MPSLFEPCGLNQIYSLRYGTVPIVRATGGLKDTVVGYPAAEATGLSFMQPDATELFEAMSQALSLFDDKKNYQFVQQRGMQQVFSWQQAALSYEMLYRQAVSAS